MSRRALITGGGGFLGYATARRLAGAGWELRSFSRARYDKLQALGVEQRQGDLADATALARAAEGCQAVFHVAALAGVWGAARDYERVNVAGTRNVIEACRSARVPKLIHTSSPSVSFAGRDQIGEDEQRPLPRRYLAHYPRSKAKAERLVLEANGPELATVALRPHLIWGPGDPHLAPRLIERARQGRLFLVGGGENRVDATYIENAAEAQLRALERLEPGAPCAGRAYYIGNGEPVALRELVNGILGAAGLDPVRRSIPAPLARGLGAAAELAWTLLPLDGEPPLTRFVARQLATEHWFNLGAALRELGYAPVVSMQEGLERLRAHYAKEQA